MEVIKPVFIVGMGRSGSTLFHEIFTKHPNLAWLSAYCNKYPSRPSVNRFLMEAIDYPLIGNFLQSRLRQGECYNFWNHYYKGFARPCRDLLSGDVTKKTKSDIYKVMSQMLTSKRNRLLFKITGWPRLGFLQEIFEDAKFVHIVRDGRAVVNSMINVPWWWGWRGPQNWRWGELTNAQKQEWEKYDKSFLVLAAIEWNILLEAFEKSKELIHPENILEIKYEDLCENPAVLFKEIVKFTELEWSREFENSVKSFIVKNTNYKWQNELTNKQIETLNNVLKVNIHKYKYL